MMALFFFFKEIGRLFLCPLLGIQKPALVPLFGSFDSVTYCPSIM